MRQRTRNILVALAIFAMVAPLVASLRAPSAPPRGAPDAPASDASETERAAAMRRRIAELAASATSVVDPADGTPEGLVGRLLTAARNTDRAAGFEAARPLLARALTESDTATARTRDLLFEGLRRTTPRLVPVSGPNAFRLAHKAEGADGRVRIFVALTDQLPRPIILVRDPNAAGAWRIEQF